MSTAANEQRRAKPPSLTDLRRRRAAILAAARRNKVSRVRVFGSVARGEERVGSDVDLLVDLDEGAGFFDLLGFKHEVEDLLGVAVDVGEAVRVRMRQRVEEDSLEL